MLKIKRRCGGLVVGVSASRSPVLGSNLGLGPPHSLVWGAEDHTVNCTNKLNVQLLSLGSTVSASSYSFSASSYSPVLNLLVSIGHSSRPRALINRNYRVSIPQLPPPCTLTLYNKTLDKYWPNKANYLKENRMQFHIVFVEQKILRCRIILMLFSCKIIPKN